MTDLDADGNIFIDRDPVHFETILHWLRDRGAPKVGQRVHCADPFDVVLHDLQSEPSGCSAS